jgi:hypothetical protein
MRLSERDQAAVDAITRAVYRVWPARIIAKTAPGWAEVILVALRQDPAGRDAVIEALREPEAPPKALGR